MSHCRSCNAPIIWALTETGRQMPIDERPDPKGNLELYRSGTSVRVRVTMPGQGRHRPHFATCPEARSWRR